MNKFLGKLHFSHIFHNHYDIACVGIKKLYHSVRSKSHKLYPRKLLLLDSMPYQGIVQHSRLRMKKAKLCKGKQIALRHYD